MPPFMIATGEFAEAEECEGRAALWTLALFIALVLALLLLIVSLWSR